MAPIAIPFKEDSYRSMTVVSNANDDIVLIAMIASEARPLLWANLAAASSSSLDSIRILA